MRSFSFVFVGMMAMAVGFGNCRCRGQETAIAAPAARPTLEAIGRHDASRTVECAKASIRVVDGDTLKCSRTKIRVLGVDTPETRKTGRYAEPGQEPYGSNAKALTERLVAEARTGLIFFAASGDDKGRDLAHVLFVGANGTEKLLGLELLNKGLAYETCGHYGNNGFAEFCRQIKAADDAAPKRGFLEPWKYKKRKH